MRSDRRTFRTRRGLLALGAILFLAARHVAAAPPTTVRIGTYDSRIVALAYYQSPGGMDSLMRQLRSDIATAHAAGDTTRVRDLSQRGPAWQNLAHQQVFGTLSIPNVLDRVAGQLPAIATRAGVDVLVSKWELHGDAKSIAQVDLTRSLADLFVRDAAGRKAVDEALARPWPAMPVDQLMNPYE